MSSNSSKGVVDRIIAWLRGFFNQGAGQIDRDRGSRAGFGGETAGASTERAEGAGTADTSTADSPTATSSTREASSSTPAPSGESLPDLDATDSDYAYTGEPSDATRPPSQAGSGGPASAAADDIEQAREERSDLDDAAGTNGVDDASLPESDDPDEPYHLHDAVGGSRATDDDDGTDGTIDTERDHDLANQHGEGDTLLGADTGGTSPSDMQAAAGGASADEFAHGGYEPAHADREDLEAAAEGESTSLDDDTATSGVGDLDQHADSDAEPHRIENFNYGAGDLGVGQAEIRESDSGTADSDAGASEETADTRGDDQGTGDLTAQAETGTMGEQGPAGSDQTDAPRSGPGAEAEAAARGDAFGQGDEAVTAPGQSDPSAFGDASTGTTEPSRSATGNDLEEGPDALGTTLDHSEESSETFDPDAANLSGEEEMTVSDLEAGEQPGSESGEESTRITTFQSGTIAQQQLEGQSGSQGAVDTPETPYAGIDDEPDVQPSDEESDLDDFSGSDYPSDRRVDRLAGDDAFDAQEPDIGQEGSSAGDVSAIPPQDDLLISESSPASADDPGTSTGTPVDLDIVSAADDSVGDEPSTTEMATGTAAGMALQPDESGDTGDAMSRQDATDDTQATPSAIADDGGAGSASTQDGDVPAGAVRGDGGSDAPEGYPVKGNANSMIYHLPDFPSYRGTKAEFYFATEDDAIAAGYRAPGNVRRAGAATGEQGGTDDTDMAATQTDSTGETTAGPSDAATSASTTEDSGEAPAGAVRGDGTTDTPEGYPVKGNASSKIYHLPGYPSYASTKAEFCFATEDDAIAAGYRAPGKRNRGRKK